MNITCKVDITPQQIADQMITALETPIGSWLASATLVGSECRNPKESIWYADPVLFSGAYQIAVRFDDPAKGDDGEHTGLKAISQDDVRRGLEAMVKKCPYQFGLLMRDEGDAITADVFLQCVLFGEEVYG